MVSCRTTSVLLWPLLVVMSGCTVLGGAIGSSFDPDLLELPPAAVGPELEGAWVTVVLHDGSRSEGEVLSVDGDLLVLAPKRDGFSPARPDSFGLKDVEMVRANESGGGRETGLAVGATLDMVAVFLFAIARALRKMNVQ